MTTPIESLPPIPSDEMQEIMRILSTITESDSEELQLLKQLALAGCGDCGSCECGVGADAGYTDRESQCVSCRYFENGDPSVGLGDTCLIAWDGEDEDETCEQVEISLFMLAEKHDCPHYTVKERTQ